MGESEIYRILRETAARGFTAADGEFRLGALLLYPNGKFFGHNQEKTHPKSTHPYGSIHAEFDVVRRGIYWGIDFKKAKLFVGRHRRDGTFGRAKPCQFCMRMINELGIKKVYWSEPCGFGFRFL